MHAQQQVADEAPIPVVQATPLKLIFPGRPGWNLLKEGEKRQFEVKAEGGTGERVIYSVAQNRVEGLVFDSLGRFSWTPGYDFVDRLTKESTVQLLFEARNEKDERASQVVDLTVRHVNRPPVVGELKPLYVQYNTVNSYTIESSAIKDDDNDPTTIVPIAGGMPEGAKLSAQGEFSWKPSVTQFNRLRDKPLVVEFYVEDQPYKARTKGQFRVEVTQQDLPPNVLLVPSQKLFRFKEDATVNLKFQVNDPNGESDIASFSFISQSATVPTSALVRNTPSQYEFIWKPGYDFVKDPLDSITFDLTFFAIDKSNKQQERTVTFTVQNAINEEENDQKLYQGYRTALARAWEMMDQLAAAEKDLKDKYRRARKGKKARSVTTATLGAGTGITPVVIEVPNTTKKVTAIGGTLVMTIGTLEATEVIGRSTKDLVERLNYIMEKRNELQTKGDAYARRYSLKSARRRPEFPKDTDELTAALSLRGLVALELEAGGESGKGATDGDIAKTFGGFHPNGR
ncbi:hypothetical protein DC20_21990 (plasmid) [Rufibacter tibetensis]|uniref:Cadherin domain-containing protein n=2 Tax=Rufibacter tibetensis TaxID=512763 RepID=A0A0P0D1W5_9BACT|nr:hypothetical protein DC20_21990 [Rufibacter tibetensis]